MNLQMWAAALPLGFIATIGAPAHAAEPMPAPQWKVGDRWDYTATVGAGDTCSKNLATGAIATVEVVAADAGGYETRRDVNGKATNQKWALDLTTQSSRGFSKLKTDAFGFAAAPGAEWESGWFGSVTVKTELRCTKGAVEKVSVPAGEFDAVPVACTGSWENSQNPAFKVNGPATAKYWYAPSERNHVKTTFTTLLPNGGGCVDVTWSLTKPKT